MRQVGILASAARIGLHDHRERLVHDHENARAIAGMLARVPGASVDIEAVQTNIVMVDTPDIPGEQVVQAARQRGVLVAQFGPRRVRVVTHLDVADTAVHGGELLAEAIDALGGRR